MQLDKYFVKALLIAGIMSMVNPVLGVALMLALIVLMILGNR